MFNFLLGVAAQQSTSQAVTEQKFTELENGIYERMKDVQDMAHTIQSDQITFLNDQISTFYTIISIAIAILTILGGWAINSIRKANKKAEEHMQLASTLMENAQTLSQEAEEKIQLLQTEQENLKNLLDSKDLDNKLKRVEETAQVTSRLRLQMTASSYLHRAAYDLEQAEEVYKMPIDKEIWVENDAAYAKKVEGMKELHTLAVEVDNMQTELNIVWNSLTFSNQREVVRQARGLMEEAAALSDNAGRYHSRYLVPVVNNTPEQEKGD
jgi:hypothetical protein